MDLSRDDFNLLLKKAKLTKKEFSEILGVGVGAVNNWGNKSQSVPYWVKSWLENYQKAKSFDEVCLMIANYLSAKDDEISSDNEIKASSDDTLD